MNKSKIDIFKEKYHDIYLLELQYFKESHSSIDSHKFLKKIYDLKKKYIQQNNLIAIK